MGTLGALAASRVWGAGGGWQPTRRGGQAGDRGEEEVDTALVAGEEQWHAHALTLDALESGGPLHLALLAVHELVAARSGLARPREEHLLAHLVAARQRRRGESLTAGGRFLLVAYHARASQPSLAMYDEGVK